MPSSAVNGCLVSVIMADSLTELKSPVIPQFVIVIFCVANVLLSSLQMYWGSLIISALAKMVKGDAADKDA